MPEMTISEIVQRLRLVANTTHDIEVESYEAMRQAADLLEKLAEISAESARVRLETLNKLGKK